MSDQQSEKRSWQEALSDLITDPKELFTLLELDPNLLDQAYRAVRVFPLKVPRGLVARMEKGNINDPLLMQVLPLGKELDKLPNYSKDPLQEDKANPIPGLLHKYQSRVLITLTSACAIHCRYCFRRHFPYSENNPGRRGWENMMDYIRQDSDINEVILSGGDPLAVSDHLLTLFSEQLTTIPHIKRLRIHTRLPVVLPERITKDFLLWASQLKQDLIIVIHTNHPREMNEEVKLALGRLRDARVRLLNQTVLLKGINDDAGTLTELSESLFSAGVMPYYLHVLDKVEGAAHFDLPLSRAYELQAELAKNLPGYLVPRLACEEPGQPSKTFLSTGLFTG